MDIRCGVETYERASKSDFGEKEHGVMTPANRIAQRLTALGLVVNSPPLRLRTGHHQREDGACTWNCDVTHQGGRYDLVSWTTMTKLLASPAGTWEILNRNNGWAQLELEIKESRDAALTAKHRTLHGITCVFAEKSADL